MGRGDRLKAFERSDKNVREPSVFNAIFERLIVSRNKGESEVGT